MHKPEFETSSISFPSRTNSSFWAWDTEQATPEKQKGQALVSTYQITPFGKSSFWKFFVYSWINLSHSSQVSSDLVRHSNPVTSAKLHLLLKVVLPQRRSLEMLQQYHCHSNRNSICSPTPITTWPELSASLRATILSLCPVYSTCSAEAADCLQVYRVAQILPPLWWTQLKLGSWQLWLAQPTWEYNRMWSIFSSLHLH